MRLAPKLSAPHCRLIKNIGRSVRKQVHLGKSLREELTSKTSGTCWAGSFIGHRRGSVQAPELSRIIVRRYEYNDCRMQAVL
jgi:hypothetical protein